ncbi:MAG: hypothetical protein OXC30_00810 [Alphaproteobacteria bacterium]|nr:hypothetical protein [Alphaproteobacteria bacterium]
MPKLLLLLLSINLHAARITSVLWDFQERQAYIADTEHFKKMLKDGVCDDFVLEGLMLYHPNNNLLLLNAIERAEGFAVKKVMKKNVSTRLWKPYGSADYDEFPNTLMFGEDESGYLYVWCDIAVRGKVFSGGVKMTSEIKHFSLYMQELYANIPQKNWRYGFKPVDDEPTVENRHEPAATLYARELLQYLIKVKNDHYDLAQAALSYIRRFRRFLKHSASDSAQKNDELYAFEQSSTVAAKAR